MKDRTNFKIILLYLKKLTLLENKILKNNKYDVLLKELRLKQIKAMYYYLKMLMLESQIADNKINIEELNKESIKIINNILPFILISSHLVYENNKDLEKTKIKLNNDYLKNIKYSIKLLLLLGIIEQKNIDIEEITDYKKLLKILNCEETSELSSDDILILNRNFNKISNSYKLDIEQQKIIEDYHQKYMKNIIHPKTDKKVTKKEVIKLAKKISKKRL